MGDPARHVRPCGPALVEQLVGDVVERDDEATFDLDLLHGEGSRISAGNELDHVFAFAAVEVGSELWGEITDLLADRILAGGLEKLFGRTVDQPHATVL